MPDEPVHVLIFDSVADMDAATVAPSGMMKDEFLVNSTLGTIDHLHPNRAGYLAMAKTIDIRVLAPPRAARGHDDDQEAVLPYSRSRPWSRSA